MTTTKQDETFFQAANSNDMTGTERPILETLKSIQKDIAAVPTGPAMNADELRSIKSLVAYFAYYAEMDKGVVASMLSANFGAEDIEHMRSADYDAAVHYLVDLDVKNAIN